MKKKRDPIVNVEQFVKGKTYIDLNGDVFTFHGREGNDINFLDEGQDYMVDEGVIPFAFDYKPTDEYEVMWFNYY